MSDYTLTFAKVVALNLLHGSTGGARYNDEGQVVLLDCLNEPSGWNAIAVCPVTHLCSRSDTLAALGY